MAHHVSQKHMHACVYFNHNQSFNTTLNHFLFCKANYLSPFPQEKFICLWSLSLPREPWGHWDLLPSRAWLVPADSDGNWVSSSVTLFIEINEIFYIYCLQLWHLDWNELKCIILFHTRRNPVDSNEVVSDEYHL